MCMSKCKVVLTRFYVFVEKQKAIVNYGLFTTQVSLDQLEIAN